MKKILLIGVAILTATISFSCSKPESDEEKPIGVSLEITDIADNAATVKASLTSGKFYGAKLVDAVVAESLEFDTTNDIQLIKFVEEKGADVTLPLEKKLTGIKIGKDMLTALIVYDETGRVCITKTVIWTPEGIAEGWSDSNNPGSLDEITW